MTVDLPNERVAYYHNHINSKDFYSEGRKDAIVFIAEKIRNWKENPEELSSPS
ncbi:MAG: hypothetical protein KBD31_00380 [Proteobacteria bacterium]|nr:hypothetical protein [Pseudomonadota bacterium]